MPESVLILGKVVSQTGGCCPSLLGHKPLARCKLEAGVLDKNRTRIQPFPRQSFSSEETVDTARYNTHAPSSWKQRWKSKPSEEPAAACSMELQTSRKSQKSTRGRIQSVVQQSVQSLAGIPASLPRPQISVHHLFPTYGVAVISWICQCSVVLV